MSIVHESFMHRLFPAAVPWRLAQSPYDGSGRARNPKHARWRLVRSPNWNHVAVLVDWGTLETLSGRLSGSSRGVVRKVSGRSSGVA
eukprot:14729720-Alexandrium_andersonii.AAC.1